MKTVDYEKLKTQLDLNEQADFRFQQRRHSQWTENYQLYRDNVIINRLTQRQSINVPLIKGIVKTVAANTDEFPDIQFEEKDNNKDKEIVFNELWKDFVVVDKLEVKDIVDKKQDFLYGITHTKFNLIGGRITTEIREPFDILRDRYADPSNYDETADHLSEHGIYRTLSQLSANPMYNQVAVNRLKVFYASSQGLIAAEHITRVIQDKNQRLEDLGVPDTAMPVLGETVVELKAHFQKIYDSDDKAEHWHLIVKADTEILVGKPLLDVLGVDFLPFVTWSDDPERNDHYPDGVADIGRTTNKLLNSMISALAENRILRNYGMNFYDSTMENFNPQTFEPIPGGYYPIPVPDGKKLDDVFKKVDIPDLSESLDEMEYVKRIVETAVAAGSTIQGNTEQTKVTLGEVQLALAAAKERITSIAKFYMLAQKEKADKWAKIMNANADKIDAVKLYKKSHKGNYFTKTVTAKDWKSETGYSCRAVSTAERQEQSIQGLQKLQATKQFFPNNPVLDKILGKKILEFADVNPDEIKEVLDAQEQMTQASAPAPGQPAAPAIPPPVPQLTPPQNALQTA
jgi:hypothetical protein